jgi:hypothetical protein
MKQCRHRLQSLCLIVLLCVPVNIYALGHIKISESKGIYTLQATQMSIRQVFNYVENNSKSTSVRLNFPDYHLAH